MTGEKENRGVAKKSEILNKMLGCGLTWRKTEDGAASEPGCAPKMKGGATSPQTYDINGTALGEEGRQSIVHLLSKG